MSNNLIERWTRQYTAELALVGVIVPEGTPYEQIKALHAQHKDKMPKKAAAPKQVKAVAPAPQLDEATIAAAIEKYMASLGAAAKGEAPAPGGEMSESQMMRIIRAVQSGEKNKSGSLNPNFVDPKDQIPAVRLFAPYKYFFIRSKELSGYPIALPNEMKSIAFQPNFPKTIVNGGKAKRQYSCYVDITSHSVYKWITGMDINGNEVGLPDPDYRAKYFTDPKEMIIDGFAIWERIYYNHRVALEAKSLNVLLGLAQDEAGITPSSHNDKTVLASRVAKVRADKEFKSAKHTNDQMREQSVNLASTMFGQPTNPIPLPAG